VDLQAPPAPWPLALDSEISVADIWFVALDQRSFTVGDVRWTTQVVGVHVDELHTWVQIEFGEDCGTSLLIQLKPDEGLQAAVNVIRAEIIRRAD